ncbi:MAG TPA: phosphate acyltransferase [Prolixibacteraceae bacterium]|nr:phosphate acyltransferase [Prolixibacteraceae bacterium]HPS13167.1 phosphate acyltransferase [Prolixibacteraceae bacterium]
MAITTYPQIFDSLRQKPMRQLVIANGVDAHSIEAGYRAQSEGFAKVIITGNQSTFEKECVSAGISPSSIQLIHCSTEDEAVKVAVGLVRQNRANAIMKGLVNTDQFLKGVLDKQNGILNQGALLSHITMIVHDKYKKPILISDVAIIPQPTFEQKIRMTEYLINVAHKLEIEEPKIAFIAASEKVIAGMPATVDADKLKKMWQDGWFDGSVCDGPMALDLAIDEESARIKNFQSPVAGDADCLLFPNIESGNVFYKTSTKLCNAQTAAIVIGTMVPAILSSRGDSMETKLNSIALALLIG